MSAVRRRWRAVALLALLTAVAGGAAMTAATGAHRSAGVVDQTMTEHRQPDVMFFVDKPGFHWGPIVHLPYVQSYGIFAATQLCLSETGGLDQAYTGALCSQPPVRGGWYRSFWRIDIPDGRMPTRPGEIAINRQAQRKYGWRIGQRLHVEGIRPGRLEDFWGGQPRGRRPWGPTIPLRVAGVFRGDETWRVITGGSTHPGFVFSRSFIPAYGGRIEHRLQAGLRLRHGEADIPRLRHDVTRITNDPTFPIRNVDEAQRRVERSTDVDAVALALFAAAVAAAAAILLGQALVRLIRSQGADAAILRSLGMDHWTLVAALAAPGAVVAVAGALGAVAVAVAASPLVPIGVARDYDLRGGVQADVAVLAFGGLAIVVATVLVSALAATLALREGRAPTASRLARLVARLPLPPTPLLGIRMAVERRSGSDPVPVASALIGASVGVLAVVAALSVRHGITATLVHPERAGKTWDLAYVADTLPTSALRHDRDVAAAAAVSQGVVDLNDVPTFAYGIKSLDGGFRQPLLHGRPPERPDEVALGPSTADALKVGVGDTLRGGARGAHRLKVVGIALLVEQGGSTGYDQGAWLTSRGLRRLGAEVAWSDYFVDAAPGAGVAKLRHRLAGAGGTTDDSFAVPAGLENLNTTRALPTLLAILLGLLGIGAVGHVVVMTVRRRRRDIAVLRTLGLTGRQASAVLAWQATTIAAAALIVGFPLGLLAGDLIWRWIAASMPLDYAAPGVPLAALLVVPAAVLCVNAAAAWPAGLAGRMHPARVLRAE